jgi:hypothetical protein
MNPQLRFYTIMSYRDNQLRYTGSSLTAAATMLVPGTVYGVGQTTWLATQEARRKAMEARRQS